MTLHWLTTSISRMSCRQWRPEMAALGTEYRTWGHALLSSMKPPELTHLMALVGVNFEHFMLCCDLILRASAASICCSSLQWPSSVVVCWECLLRLSAESVCCGRLLRPSAASVFCGRLLRMSAAAVCCVCCGRLLRVSAAAVCWECLLSVSAKIVYCRRLATVCSCTYDWGIADMIVSQVVDLVQRCSGRGLPSWTVMPLHSLLSTTLVLRQISHRLTSTVSKWKWGRSWITALYDQPDLQSLYSRC